MPLPGTRPLIMYPNHQGHLDNPPALKDVLTATNKFAPKYDLWMEHHHQIASELIRQMLVGGHMGRVIAEIGCGTGIITANLATSLFSEFTVHNVKTFNQPIVLVCTDISDLMLQMARANIRKRFEKMIQMGETIPGGLKNVSIRVRGDEMKLLYKDKTLMYVMFFKKDAEEVHKLEVAEPIETVIVSYVTHWVRGLEAKATMVENIGKVLGPGGTVISAEECPLIVRADLLPDDMGDLTGAIEKATSVIGLDTLRQMYISCGFRTLKNVSMQIDELSEHRMHVEAFEKLA